MRWRWFRHSRGVVKEPVMDEAAGPLEPDDGERYVEINRSRFKVPGRTMPAADLYALPIPPLDPYKHDLWQQTPGHSPDSWVDPRQVVDFDQGDIFYSTPRHLNN